MAQIVNTIDNIVFELNGVRYPKIFVAIGSPVGGDNIDISNIYDNKTQLVAGADFSSFIVDGASGWADAAALLQVLQPILAGTTVQAQTLAALSDVVITGITNNDILQWNGFDWINTGILNTTSFVSPTLDSDFTDIDMQYRLYNGVLEITGSFTRLLDSANDVVFTLPVGFRPTVEKRILGYNSAGFRNTFIQTDGDVVMTNATSAGGTHYITCYIPVDI